MAQAMTAAFACELVMKAICLTCKDEAKQTHDLLDLNDGLEVTHRRARLSHSRVTDSRSHRRSSRATCQFGFSKFSAASTMR